MDACPIIVLVFNLWLRHVSPPPSNGGRWPQLEAEEALFWGLCGAFVGLVVGCVGGICTGLCAGLALALSHGSCVS